MRKKEERKTEIKRKKREREREKEKVTNKKERYFRIKAYMVKLITN